MNDLLTLPWERIGERSAIANRMAAKAAREVIERRFDAGRLLTEADLAASHGASRTPAREAMLQLERWGLVRLIPKKGAIVTQVSVEERRDLLAVRAMFEINAIEVLTDRDAVVDGLGSDLQELLALQRSALEDNDPMAFASADYAFHARIIRAADNGVVAEMLDGLGPRLARLTFLAVIEQPSALELLLTEHEQLTDRASSGDAAGFAGLVRQHIESGHFRRGEPR